jgi:hypothetical protein
MMQAISLILALAKAIPIIDKWLGELAIAYQVYKKEQVAEQTRIEIDLAVENQDQRKIESENYSGNYSGHGDIRTSIPGVLRDKKPD